MAEAGEDEIVDSTPGYTAPKKVALDTLKNLDKDDEALNRWKAALLAGTNAGEEVSSETAPPPFFVVVFAFNYYNNFPKYMDAPSGIYIYIYIYIYVHTLLPLFSASSFYLLFFMIRLLL